MGTIRRLNSIHKGFATGIALSLLVAVGIFSAVHATSAQADDMTATSAFTSSTDDTAGTASMPTTATDTAAIPQAVAVAPASSAAAAPKHTNAYVGLGDSVAAGAGLKTWPTATAQDKQCQRSPYSYVFEVGRQLNRPHAPYACSGATSASLLSNSAPGTFNPNLQLDQAFQQGVPAIISVTVGANDIGWSDVVKSCYTGDCGTAAQADAVSKRLGSLQANLVQFMQQVQDKSGDTPPQVILTGYYNPVSDACPSATADKISAPEVAWMTGGVEALNTTIKQVAQAYGSFAVYAPVSFTGHDICSATPWIQGLTDPAPLHPNAAGQGVIATSVVQAARSNVRL